MVKMGIGLLVVGLFSAAVISRLQAESGCGFYAVPILCPQPENPACPPAGPNGCSGVFAAKEFDLFACGGPALQTTSCHIDPMTPLIVCYEKYGCIFDQESEIPFACTEDLNDYLGFEPGLRNITRYNDPNCPAE